MTIISTLNLDTPVYESRFQDVYWSLVVIDICKASERALRHAFTNMAFTYCVVHASLRMSNAAPEHKQSCARRTISLSRRSLCGTLALALLHFNQHSDAAAADAEPYLPGGAAEFSRVLTARKRWSELGSAVAKSDEPLSDGQWDSARKYLRAFYSIGNDMKSLAKPWDADKKSRALDLVKQLQSTVKAMDVPAQEHDPQNFLQLHTTATDFLNRFLDVYTEVAQGSIPAEL